MNDKKFESLLNDKLDGLLTPDESREFETILRQNPSCRRQYQNMMQVAQLLGEVQPLPLPADFAANVLARIHIPWYYRVQNALMRWATILVLRPIMTVGIVTFIIMSRNSYVFLFNKMLSLLSLKSLLTPFSKAAEIKTIVFWLKESFASLVHFLNFSNLWLSISKTFFTLVATLWMSLSYLLPVAIIVIVLWTFVLYLMTEPKGSLQYA